MAETTSWKRFDSSQRWAYNEDWNSWSTGNEAYAGHANGIFYTAEFTFTTPSFTGLSKSITLSFSTKYNYDRYPAFRYAIVTSDANNARYLKTYNAVSDANQIASGASYWDYLSSGYTDHEITIPCSKLKPNRQYAIFLWAHSSNNLAAYNIATEHWFYITYDKGLVRLDDGSSIKTAVPYIDNGAEWVRAMPYIDDGSSWNLGV